MNKELPEMKVITTILQEYELMYKDFKCENEQLKERLDKAVKYNEHLIRDSKYHLNLGHLKKMHKILKGSSNEKYYNIDNVDKLRNKDIHIMI